MKNENRLIFEFVAPLGTFSQKVTRHYTLTVLKVMQDFKPFSFCSVTSYSFFSCLKFESSVFFESGVINLNDMKRVSENRRQIYYSW